MAVAHHAALLRRLGTHNSKDGGWAECMQLVCANARYDLFEIADWLDDVEGCPLFTRKAAGNGRDKAAIDGAAAECKPPIDVEARLAAMRHEAPGENSIHLTQLSVTASLLRSGVALEETTRVVLEATRAAVAEDPRASRWNWRREERKIRRMAAAFIGKNPELATLLPDSGEPQAPKAATKPRRGPDPVGSLIQSSAEFVDGFVPPDYLIDGWLIRQFVYSMTGMTGHGKTTVVLLIAALVACGLPLDGRQIEKSRVLFFAGENPDDIRMRWIKLCEELGYDPPEMDVHFMPGTPPISVPEIRARIDAEAARRGPFGLLIVDTSAAYFRGDDENSNVQLGAHARMMRSS
jgi:hypothetical protein